jgi:hypothetical protein
VWETVNRGLNAAFDVVFWPLHWLPPFWQLAVLAVPAALLSLLVYRAVSNQRAIRDAKDKIIAYLLELRIFRDDLGVLLGAQARIFLNIGRYLMYSLVPMAVLLPIFVVLIAQVESRFAFRGLDVGGEALLAARIDKNELASTPIDLEADQGLEVVTPVLRRSGGEDAYWRVKAVDDGPHTLALRVGDREARSALRVGAKYAAAPISYRSNDIRLLLYPASDGLPADGPVEELSVDYPRARGDFLGLSSATWTLFALVMLLALILRPLVGVTF